MIKNILTLNTANSGGGAEKVAYNLCRELHLRGYNNKLMAYRINYDADPLAREIVIKVPGKDIVYSAGNFLDEIFSTNYLFYLPSWRIPFMRSTVSADVIHFHNLHGYYFNILTAPLLMLRKPVVWTFHDMWAFTGKCVWSFGCERYQQSCGECPQLSYYPVLKKDTSRFHLRLKKFLYGNRKFVIVTPSDWLRQHAAQSILRNIPMYVIPSPVDTKVFFPEPQMAARQRLGIPPDKKVILFVASWINSIPHKGIATFKEMLGELYSRRSDMYTIVVGHLQGQSVLGDQFLGKETGWIDDPALLRTCYAASDVFISPTLAENSSCTIVEAMASGTATIAYGVGGIPEQITHNETGLLVPPGDKKSLLDAILSMLDNPQKRTFIAGEAAKRAAELFGTDVFVRKYLDVYQEAIKRKTNPA